MLLYLELKRWIVTAWQINMQWQTPNSNTISLPLFFLQIVPTFATGSGSETHRKDSYCTVVTFVLLLSEPPLWRFWSTNAFWTAAKPSLQAPAVTAKHTPENCRALVGPQILVSTTTLCGTEDSWSPIFLKLFVWGPGSSYSFSPKELNWHFYHQEGGAVVKCPAISEETSGTWCQVLIHRWQSLP